jgi:hypothetical protein
MCVVEMSSAEVANQKSKESGTDDPNCAVCEEVLVPEKDETCVACETRRCCDKDGKRATPKIEVLTNCTYVFCTSYEGTQSHKSAMKSRFTCIELPPNSEHNKAKVT